MKKIITKITSIVTMFAIIMGYTISPAYSATKLSPSHLYYWAKTKNFSRLNQFKRYINLQNENNQTALCLAQEAKDRNSYITLIKFGASTKVSCHDDDDPICAVILKEETKVSPAVLLLGAGAIGAAYLLNDDDDDNDKTETKACDLNEYPFENSCPAGMTENDRCKDKSGTHLKCIPNDCSQYTEPNCDTEGISIKGSCTTNNNEGTNETTTYQCQCATGWDEGTCDGKNYTNCEDTPENAPIKCHKVTSCDLNEYPFENSCPDDMTENDRCEDKSGTHHSCSCDNVNRFSDQTTCTKNKKGQTGYDCSNQDENGCYIRTELECTAPHQSSCEDAKEGYTLADNGSGTYAGETECRSCSYSCDGTTLIAEENKDPNKTYSDPITEHGVTCYKELGDKCDRTIYASSENCTLTTGLKNVASCTEKTATGTVTYYQCACDDTSNNEKGYYPEGTLITKCGVGGDNGWNWKTNTISNNDVTLICLTCEMETCENPFGTGDNYECLNNYEYIELSGSNNYDYEGNTKCWKCNYQCKEYSDQTSCENDITGDNHCVSKTTTLKDGSTIKCFVQESCPSGYTAFKSKEECEQNGTFSCTDHQSAPGCYLQTPNSCTYYDENAVTECTDHSADGYISESTPVGKIASGEECYTCSYSCDTTNGWNDGTCDGKNYTNCEDTPENAPIKCHKVTSCDLNEYPFENSCPTGLKSTGSCQDTSGTHHSCACDEAQNYYSDQTTCTKNKKGQTGYDCSKQDENGCYIRTELKCIDPNFDECTPASEGYTLTDEGAGSYAGETECRTCSYSCDETTLFATCPEGKICTEVTEHGITCQTNPQCPDTHPFTEQTVCEQDGYTCSENQKGSGCWARTGNKPCETLYENSVQSCTDYSGYTTNPTQVGTAGDQQCYTCSYSCDGTTLIAEENKDPNKTYSDPITEHEVTCYKELDDKCDRTIYTSSENCTLTTGLKNADSCTETTATGDVTYYQCQCADGWEEGSCDGKNYTNCEDTPENAPIECHKVTSCDASYNVSEINVDTLCQNAERESCTDALGTHYKCSCDRNIYTSESECNMLPPKQTPTRMYTNDLLINEISCKDVDANGNSNTYHKCACEKDTITCETSQGWEIKDITFDVGSNQELSCQTCEATECNIESRNENNNYITAPNISGECDSIDGLSSQLQDSTQLSGGKPCKECSYTCADTVTDDTPYEEVNHNINGNNITCRQAIECDSSVGKYNTKEACEQSDLVKCTQENGIGCWIATECSDNTSTTECTNDNTNAFTLNQSSASLYNGEYCYKCTYECNSSNSYRPSSELYSTTQCGEAGDNVFTLDQQTSVNTSLKCNKCIVNNCSENGLEIGGCSNYDGLTFISSSSIGKMADGSECYKCNYQCDFYSNKEDCVSAAGDGEYCVNISSNPNIECYDTTTCPETHPSTYESKEECEQGGYDCEESNIALGCFKREARACTQGSTDITPSKCAIQNGGDESGWILKDTGYISGDKTCNECEAKPCPDGSTTSDDLTHEEWTIVASQSIQGYSGKQICYKFELICNNDKNSFSDCPEGYSCLEKSTTATSISTGVNVSNELTCNIVDACDDKTLFNASPTGFSCTEITDYDITCQKPEMCDADNDYHKKEGEVKTGFTYTTTQEINGITCIKIIGCNEGLDYYTESEKLANTTYAREEYLGFQCFKPYTCNIANGEYTSQKTCTQNGAFSCIQNTNNDCYVINGCGENWSETCPSGTCESINDPNSSLVCYKNITCSEDEYKYNTEEACEQNGIFVCEQENNIGCWIATECSDNTTPSYDNTIFTQITNTHNGYGNLTCSTYSYTCNTTTNEWFDYDDSMTTVNMCGSLGDNGHKFDIETMTYNDTTLQCARCVTFSCTDNSGTNYNNVVIGQCPQNLDYLTYLSANQAGTSDTGEQCYQCNYQCEYSSEEECTEDYADCIIESEYREVFGLECWVPSNAPLNINEDLTQTTNTTLIEKTSTGSEDVYGMISEENLKNTTNQTTGEVGKIKITHNSTGSAYGMYGSSNNTLTNDLGASIEIANNQTGTAVGMYASRGGSVVNKGDITITGKNGTAVGILGEGENHIINSGSINVEGKNAYGIRVLDGTNTTIINEGSINVDGENEAYGIYIDQNASVDTVTNEGTITINKNQNDTSRSIVLNGAELRNKGTMSVTGDLDLNTLGASKVYLEDGATYEANSIKGDLTAGTSTVMNDNLDTYVKTNAIKSKDVDNLSVSSESALFTAKVNKNNEGNSDVVLERKDFSEFTPNKSMADYLTKNYQSKNFEDKFNSLKSEATSLAVQQQLADFMAFDKILNFADENFQVLRSLNRTMADTILKPTEEPYRVIAGYDNFNLETDNKGLLSGYDLNAHSMFTFGDKRLNNWSRLGLGISFTDMSTTYEKGGSRDLNIVSIFMPYLRKFGDKLNLVTILNLGYGYGDYDRGADRKADINDFIYSLTNELRYSINLNNFAELEPALMLNAIGYQEDSLDEKNSTDGIETKKTNNLSVELGAGLFIKKEVKLEKYGKLGFKIGGVYYHEFASPYRDISIHNKNNSYWYKINDYANLYQRDRAVLEAVVDYAYKDLALYVKYNKLIQKNNPDLFDMGIKFNF